MAADPRRAAEALGEVIADIESSTREVTGGVAHRHAPAEPQAMLESTASLLADLDAASDALRARRRSCPGPASDLSLDAAVAADVVEVRRSSGLLLGQRLATCSHRLASWSDGLDQEESSAGRSGPGPSAEAVAALVRRADHHLAAARRPPTAVSDPLAVRRSAADAARALREADGWRGAAGAARGRAGHLRPRLDDAGRDASARSRAVGIASDRVAASGRAARAALAEAAQTLAAAG